MASLMRQLTVSYVDAAGRKVSSKTSGATRKKHRSAKWYGQYRDAAGKRRRVPLSAHKPTAERMLAELVRREELTSAGIPLPQVVRAAVALDDHVTDWHRVLLARGGSIPYAGQRAVQTQLIFTLIGAEALDRVTPTAVELAIAGLKTRGKSRQTCNHHLQSVKQFMRWLVADGRADVNPVAHLARGNVTLDRRHDRRELADAELSALLAAAEAGPVRSRLLGPDRAMLYLTAVYTGFRASELASLTPESFALTGPSPAAAVQAAYAKNRRADSVPLHPALVPRLAAWLADKPAGGRVWPGKWASGCRGGAMLKLDLATARAAWVAEAPNEAERARREASDHLAYRDAAGRFADFHALRHTFVSRLVRSGATPKEAQTLARHSTITLTMDRYAQIDRGSLAGVVGRMSAVGGAG